MRPASDVPRAVKDFAWWTKLIAADVKTGLTIARPSSNVFLLPGFDEYMLGYQDRGAALPA